MLSYLNDGTAILYVNGAQADLLREGQMGTWTPSSFANNVARPGCYLGVSSKTAYGYFQGQIADFGEELRRLSNRSYAYCRCSGDHFGAVSIWCWIIACIMHVLCMYYACIMHVLCMYADFPGPFDPRYLPA